MTWERLNVNSTILDWVSWSEIHKRPGIQGFCFVVLYVVLARVAYQPNWSLLWGRGVITNPLPVLSRSRGSNRNEEFRWLARSTNIVHSRNRLEIKRFRLSLFPKIDEWYLGQKPFLSRTGTFWAISISTPWKWEMMAMIVEMVFRTSTHFSLVHVVSLAEALVANYCTVWVGNSCSSSFWMASVVGWENTLSL